MKKLLILFVFFCTSVGFGQVVVGDNTTIPNNIQLEDCAELQLDSEDKGLLIPRAEKEDIDATTSDNTASGMLTYDPSENTFYLKNDSGWVKLHEN